jgi:hypothetical protein
MPPAHSVSFWRTLALRFILGVYGRISGVSLLTFKFEKPQRWYLVQTGVIIETGLNQNGKRVSGAEN